METLDIKQFSDNGREKILQQFRMIDPGSEFTAFDRRQLEAARNADLIKQLVNEACLLYQNNPHHPKVNLILARYLDNALLVCRKSGNGSLDVVGYAVNVHLPDDTNLEDYVIDTSFNRLMSLIN